MNTSRQDCLRILPALLAIAFPLALMALSGLLRSLDVAFPPSGGVIAASVFTILASAFVVMGLSFFQALRLGRLQLADSAPLRGRPLAHLAFATPSLLVGLGNISGVLHMRVLVAYVWPLFWILVIVLVLAAPGRESARVLGASARRRLALAHGFSALAIIILFLALHLSDHLSGIWNGATHIAVMKWARLVYRGVLIEPLLLGLIAFQIVSGAVLVRRRLHFPSDFFGTLQTMTGTYVGIYFLAHMTAVFSARNAGVDTNWNWLTDNDKGLLDHLSNFTLVAHYWVGPAALATHIACGLRLVMLEHRVKQEVATGIAWVLIGLGVAATSVMLAALLGVHLA